MSELKARNLIPGWPRGRSTSRPVAAGSLWPWVCVVDLISMKPIGVFPRMELTGLSRRGWPADSKTLHLDHAARLEERLGRQAEERRKADMMEAFYQNGRYLAEVGLKVLAWTGSVTNIATGQEVKDVFIYDLWARGLGGNE